MTKRLIITLNQKDWEMLKKLSKKYNESFASVLRQSLLIAYLETKDIKLQYKNKK